MAIEDDLERALLAVVDELHQVLVGEREELGA
jgi:hypothetical protein